MASSAQLPATISGNTERAARSGGGAPEAVPRQELPQTGAGAESLLRQLSEQKHATIRVMQMTQQIEKQLAETRQELNRALMMASIPPEPPQSPAESEGGEAQPETVLQRAREDLETERQGRNDDRVTAAVRIARLEESVANARAMQKTAADTLRRGRLMWGVMTAAVMLGFAFLLHVAARYPGTALAETLRSGLGGERTAESTPLSKPGPTPERNSPAAEAEAMAPQTALEGALKRMNRALAAYPDEKPEEIIDGLRNGHIHIDPSSCLVAWNEGQPELLLQDRTHDRARIAQTLSDCASAIENARNNMIFGQAATKR
jgi:hypothetical protein